MKRQSAEADRIIKSKGRNKRSLIDLIPVQPIPSASTIKSLELTVAYNRRIELST